MQASGPFSNGICMGGIAKLQRTVNIGHVGTRNKARTHKNRSLPHIRRGVVAVSLNFHSSISSVRDRRPNPTKSPMIPDDSHSEAVPPNCNASSRQPTAAIMMANPLTSIR